MRAKVPPLHIHHNATPDRLRAILECANRDTPPTLVELSQELRLASGTVQHILPLIRHVGLLNTSGLSLTELGEQFQHLDEQSPILFVEAMHYLLYTSHTFDTGKRFSWAYARVVDALWESSERLLDGTATAQLVGMVVDEAARIFGIPVEEVAFSRKSVRGVLNWLRELDPPVVTSEGRSVTFSRRYFCPVPTFLWAMDFIYRLNETPYGVRLFLTEERIEQVCKLCVLDPSGLDNVLAMAKRTYNYERGEFFDYGTTGGFGRWVLLSKPFGFGDVASR